MGQAVRLQGEHFSRNWGFGARTGDEICYKSMHYIITAKSVARSICNS